MPRIDTQKLDLNRSMEFDKELFLDDLVTSMRTSREEFERLYILEEFPMDVTCADFSDFRDIPIEFVFTTRQEFHVRSKTAEEMAEDFSHSLTQGEI